MRHLHLLTGSLLLLLCNATLARAVTIYTDRAAWEAALTAPLLTEGFDQPVTLGTSIRFGSGITSTRSPSGGLATRNDVAGGVFTGFLQRDGARVIDWDLGQRVSAFGGSFGGALASLFVTGRFDGVTETLSVSGLLGNQPGFFGIIGTGFDGLRFTTLSGSEIAPGLIFGGETFTADDLAFAPVAVVPLPAGLVLLLSALGGLTLAGWRRRA